MTTEIVQVIDNMMTGMFWVGAALLVALGIASYFCKELR